MITLVLEDAFPVGHAHGAMDFSSSVAYQSVAPFIPSDSDTVPVTDVGEGVAFHTTKPCVCTFMTTRLRPALS